jgi:hypothetical protein
MNRKFEGNCDKIFYAKNIFLLNKKEYAKKLIFLKMEDKKDDEPEFIKIVPPWHKGVQLPEKLKWITVNPKSHKLTETILKLEIEGLEENIQKLTEELSLLRKRKFKELGEDEKEGKCEKKENLEKEEEKISLALEQPEQLRKKYQKSKRVCPCCNVVVIRHFCPHTACEKDCPIKLAYLKKKMKMDLEKK